MSMEMARRRHARAAAFVLAIAFSSAASATMAPTEAPGRASASHDLFSYVAGSPTGPDKWGSLQQDWAICHHGTKQSPIDISQVVHDNKMGPLKQSYKASNGTMENRGHNFVLEWKGGNGNLTVDGKDYPLHQVHWHAPSEHTVNGTRFDAEIHMVHEDANKARTVVAVLFSTKEAGHPSKMLNHLGKYFKKLAGKKDANEEVKEPIDPAAWIDRTSGYYRYEGSLTTPPCTEPIIWTVMSKVKHISRELIKDLESVTKIVQHNNRPTQKLNDRVVRYYEGETKDRAEGR